MLPSWLDLESVLPTSVFKSSHWDAIFISHFQRRYSPKGKNMIQKESELKIIVLVILCLLLVLWVRIYSKFSLGDW